MLNNNMVCAQTFQILCIYSYVQFIFSPLQMGITISLPIVMHVLKDIPKHVLKYVSNCMHVPRH